MQQAPPVPPRGGRRAPPPLNTPSVDSYNNKQYYGNQNPNYPNNAYYNSGYQNQGDYNNNHLQFPNNTRHQRMNSSSSGIMPPSPQPMNSYPQPVNQYSPQQLVNNYPYSQPTYSSNNVQGYPKYSPTVQSSPNSSIRGPPPPPKINYSSLGSPAYSVNNSVSNQQTYGQQQNPRNYYPQNSSYSQEQRSPEIYISSETSLPNPPRKYVPSNVQPNDPPPPPRRQVVPPSNHKVSSVRLSGGSSPSLSPQLNGRTSPIPPQRRSILVKSDGNSSPIYRYSIASYSPSLGEISTPPRQYQRGRNTSMSSQVNQLSNGNQGSSIGSSSPRYENNSPSLNEDYGLYKSSNHRRNYSYSSSITVPNMEYNDNEDGFNQDHHSSLMVKDNNGIRQSMASQVSSISQLSGISKSTNNYSEIKENNEYNEYDSSDDDIEEAKSKNEKRVSIEAEDLSKLLQDTSTVILDEKTLAANTEQTYKNLDPNEAKELQRLSLNLKNIDDSNTFNFEDFDFDEIDKKIKNGDSDISIIKGDGLSPVKGDKGKLSEEVDRSNQELLNVLSDEIKDLFKQVDENDLKDNQERTSFTPIERIQQQHKFEHNDSIITNDSIQVTDVFTHLNGDYNDENNPSPNTSMQEYEEYPSYRSSVHSNNESVYYGDDKSFSSYTDNRSIRKESLASPSPSLDPGVSAVPPKRPPRYYEKNNTSQKNEGYGPSNSPTITPGAAPAVPPRRHYRNSNADQSSLLNPKRHQSSEIAPPPPPRTQQSQQGNRRIINSNSNALSDTPKSQSSIVNNTYYNEQSPIEDNLKSEPISKSSTEKTAKSVRSLTEESIKEEKFEDDFVYHSGDIREKFPLVYHSANMSEIAANFRKRIKLVKHIKDSIEYLQSFSGYDAVSALADILGTEDRKVAQTTGQALEEQGMFHDVTYLHKLLDSHYHYYQFEDLAKPIAILERKETERLSPNDRKSLMRKLTERKGNKEFEENDPCGVLVNIAQCYSPTCTDDSPCYSYSCPRRKIMETITAKETAGRFANMAMTIGLQTTWSSSLGKSYVSKMSRDAIKRQEIMYEFIRTEKEYVNDLQSVIKYMIYPLRHGKVPGVDDLFVDNVFGNIEEISQVNSDFYEGLRKIQKRKPVLESMGDVVKEHVVNFKCYIKYGESQPSAKQILQVQKNKNPQLTAFLKECQNMPQFRRLPIESFLARPTTRLGRYPILIRDILKNTSKNHRDQILLKEANNTIESILKEVNQVAGKEANRLKMDQWSELLRFEKKNDISAIHFDDPKREYIREGKLSLVVHNIVNEPSLEVTLLLLDNVAVITYERNNNYHIYGKPIPISLLMISHSEEKKSIKPHSDSHSGSKKLVVNNHGKNNDYGSMGYIFTLKHLGVATYNFFTPILSEQKAWVEAIQKQQESLPKPIAKEIIFFSHKKLDSPVQTIHRLRNGALLLANDIGLYVLINNIMMKPLLQLSKITQVETMEQFDIIFILANRETYAFSINLLLKGVYTNPSFVRHNKKISSNVSFIATGFCDDKFLLCCAKASTNKTVVKMFEPKKLLLNPNYRKTYQKLYLTGDVVTSFKQFYIPSEGVNIRFLRRSLCVACIKSFEVVSIKNLTTQSLLNPNDVVFKNLLKSEYSPMNMFKTQQNDFLLCYNKIGFFIDKNGNRSRPNIFFKWNTTPRGFAYRSPHIYVINSEYIAIWSEFDTKEPKQIIAGNSVRLLLHDDSQNLIYSRNEDGKQRLATIEIIKPPPVIIQTQMQFSPPQIKN